MNFDEIKRIDEEFQVLTYKKMPLSIERGRGSWVWTSDGEKYLDLYGGHAVCGTGHSHPKVVEAVTRQAHSILFYSNLAFSKIRAQAAERLVSIAPKQLSKAFFCSSGTEANENAMRMARMATGRRKIVSFSGGFHGRTADAISATFLGKYRQLGEPNVPDHVEAPFGDSNALSQVIDSETAGVIIEPIQSMAGVREAEPEFFQELRAVCDRVGAILIFDEIQTGVGRTGTWFFSGSKHAGGVVPDIISLAKSLGSGVPVGACVVTENVASGIKVNDLGTTFGGGMLAMAAVIATVDAIESDRMLENALNFENAIRDRISVIDGVVSVKGRGCLLGVEFESPAAPIVDRLLAARIITGTSSDRNVMRLLPPLCTSIDDVGVLAEALNA